MSTLAVGLITLALLLTCVLLGWHIGVSLTIMSVVGIYLSIGDFNIAINILATTAYTAIKDYLFGIIPLFMLMGMLANLADASTDLYNAANVLLRKVRGGLAIATIAANAVFAAITGVTVASAAIFTKIAMPEMARLGYDKKFAAGTVAGSSVLGMLIPPSILMIVYGGLAEVSIGKLFVAGVLPGLTLAAVYIVGVIIMSYVWPHYMPLAKLNEEDEMSRKERLKLILKPWPAVILIIVTLGGIWFGFFTPTEAGGIGAFGALILAASKRRLSAKNLWKTLLDTGVSSGSIFFVLIAAQMYARMLAMSGIVTSLAELIAGLVFPPIVILIIFMVVFLIMGCILDSTSILLLCMPLMVPVVSKLGMDLIWFGIITILGIEAGLLTPPFGLSIFTIKSALPDDLNAELQIEDLFRGSFPFFIMMLIALAILIAFPTITTYLPSLMGTVAD